MPPKVAISIGDVNGIGPRLAIGAHDRVRQSVEPLYLVDRELIEESAKLMGVDIPDDFTTLSPGAEIPTLSPGEVDAGSGAYGFASFRMAVEMADRGEVDAVCTLPIHKKGWEMAGIPYHGHTEFLRDYFSQDAIMMLGCSRMFVALYTEHIPLRAVADEIEEERLTRFLVSFASHSGAESVAVLGLNPHAGDDGVIGDEERVISRAISRAGEESVARFYGPIVPDVAFTPGFRERFTHYVALYHDQGLAPLKALYFDESINVSLGLPILRTSVDHGTAMDIAYRMDVEVNEKSYINAIEYIARRARDTDS